MSETSLSQASERAGYDQHQHGSHNVASKLPTVPPDQVQLPERVEQTFAGGRHITERSRSAWERAGPCRPARTSPAVDRLRGLSLRPPTPRELAATYDLLRAWDETVASGREREVPFARMAEDRGILKWFAYWSPAESRWWDDDGSRSLAATGLSGYDDNGQFGWLVPQESGQALVVVSVAESLPLRTGSAPSKRRPRREGRRLPATP
jgi:hypothetical protein